MKVYLVGGAIRDRLLGRPVKENDWVVVGSTPEEMVAQGFRPIGKHFPVFLHPKTHEEYALARTERKTAKGYHGFEFYAAPEVSLEEDLKRRDLTINAIAEDENGNLIDPFGGQQDINNKIFRHVSSAFEEDPVRLLRVCRFSAMMPDFKIAPETLRLMQNMVASGEIDALVPERIWQELSRALSQEQPMEFFHVADRSNAFRCIFKEISDFLTLRPLQPACELTQDPTVRFAATFGQLSPKNAQTLCQRLRAPNEYTDLLELVCHYYEMVEFLENKPEAILTLLEKLDPFRRESRFENFLIAIQAIYRTRHQKSSPSTSLLHNAYRACETIKLSELDKKSSGKEVAAKLRALRLRAIEKLTA